MDYIVLSHGGLIMPQNKLSAHQISVNRFWDNYLLILKKNAIPANSMPYYRQYAEAYIKSNKDTPLSAQTGQNIDRYLNTKGRQPELKE